MDLFNGLGIGFGGIARLSNAVTRSISAENFTGVQGAGGMATDGTGAQAARGLGQGWKVSPRVRIAPGTTFTLGEIAGPVPGHEPICAPGNFRLGLRQLRLDGEQPGDDALGVAIDGSRPFIEGDGGNGGGGIGAYAGKPSQLV